MEASVSHLLTRNDIWLASQNALREGGIPTGFARLDQHLAQGGWPQHGVVELLGEAIGLSPLLQPLLSQAEQSRWLLCVAPPLLPYGPGLQQLGVDLSRFVCVETPCEQERLWALEQALNSGRCGLVLAWLSAPTVAQVRRLQLAAERGRCLLMLHLPEVLAEQPHPVPLRLQWAHASGGIRVTLLKQRGGWPRAPFLLPFREEGPSSALNTPVLVQGPW
ncbi:translesion DNA synthesis-associated protein ImuA [Ferrimonas balearica]|uniref:translesion DNA synthesis-associated protein ImuA n=1 Tax=Ferrimonas balearica TaxID=44012 RepID=UPI001C99DC67|nr:translesion DNA synthesis-associated protein ImuA [Ferrimonas balearica]MBY5920067.1 translesion DNA synthesis-associated protein ImuA [Ferrimonas balearica]MBY5997248.1 translesion DNA synthesis-associated protein ImuA [Ferrimonas balearica]